MEDRYLGDGVYASYDDYHIWLDLRGQDTITRIALEPAVILELIRYQSDAIIEKHKITVEVLPSEPDL